MGTDWLDNCKECPLLDGALVPSCGPLDARIVIVGESPGRTEIQQRKPFVGPSGKVLAGTLKVHDLDIARVYLTNAVLCGTIIKKSPAELSRAMVICNERLKEQILKVGPTWVVALGNVAFHAVARLDPEVFPKPLPGIMAAAGRRWYSPVLNAWVLAVIHPAAVLYRIDLFGGFRDSLEMIARPPVEPFVAPPVHICYTEDQALAALVSIWGDSDEFVAVDVETTGFSPTKDALLCIQLATLYSNAVIPWDVVEDSAPVHAALRKVFYTKYCGGHNAQFDRKFLSVAGFDFLVRWDTLLGSYCYDERARGRSLKKMVCRLLGVDDWQVGFEKGLPRKGSSYAEAEPDTLFHYGGLDVIYNRLLWEDVRKKLPPIREGRGRSVYNMLLEATNALADIELNGVLIDLHRVATVLDELEVEEEEVHYRIVELAGYDVNPNSPKQLMELFYEKLKLPKQFKDGKLTTNAVAMAQLAAHSEIPALIVKYRHVRKMRSTYVRPLPSMVDIEGRLHPQFMLFTTVTGRLSSRDPNVQNIPRVGPYRDLYIAPPGKVLMEVDYSQIELRVLTKLSLDPELHRVYRDGLDLHSDMAEYLFGKDYTSEQRTLAKTLNFATIYGQSAKAIAKSADFPGFTEAKAEYFVRRFHARLQTAFAWLDAQGDKAIATGELRTPFGRVRRFPIITRDTYGEVRRQAANFAIQSIASDLTLQSLLTLHRARGPHARIVMTVHDSIILEVDRGSIELTMRHAISTMKEVADALFFDDYIPVEVSVKIGESWGQAKEIVLDAQSDEGYSFV